MATKKTAKVRWSCPTGEHKSVLGPKRPRLDSAARFCLECSAATGKMVERVAYVVEAERTARDEKAAKRRAATLARARAREAARCTVDGRDMRDDLERLIRTTTFKEACRDSLTHLTARQRPDMVTAFIQAPRGHPKRSAADVITRLALWLFDAEWSGNAVSAINEAFGLGLVYSLTRNLTSSYLDRYLAHEAEYHELHRAGLRLDEDILLIEASSEAFETLRVALDAQLSGKKEVFDKIVRELIVSSLDAKKKYAAIGTDGTRAVVWGVGATIEEAEADARSQDTGGLDLTLGELRFVKIDFAREVHIAAGDIDAEDLWLTARAAP